MYEPVTTVTFCFMSYLNSPNGDLHKPMSALLFDSWYDQYKGVICLVAVLNGCLKKGKISLT